MPNVPIWTGPLGLFVLIWNGTFLPISVGFIQRMDIQIWLNRLFSLSEYTILSILPYKFLLYDANLGVFRVITLQETVLLTGIKMKKRKRKYLKNNNSKLVIILCMKLTISKHIHPILHYPFNSKICIRYTQFFALIT